MRMFELKEKYIRGGVEKKCYLQLMRENYTHYLAEIGEVLADSDESKCIMITKEGCILERKDSSKIYFDFTQSICRAEVELLTKGDPESKEMELVGEFLSQFQCRAVFDIGANVGLYSLNLYQRHRELEYYLFEPIPTTYAQLKKTQNLNQIDEDHYKTFNVGMSDAEGQIKFYVPAANEAASMVANEDDFYKKRSDSMGGYTGETNIEEVICQVTTLDSFVKQEKIKQIDFIKIDVEGNEKAVLEGAKDSIIKFRPLVYTELLRKHARRFGYHPNDVIRSMQTLGYDCVTMQDGEIIEIESINEQTVQTNFFFLYPQKHGGFFKQWMNTMMQQKLK